MEIVALGMEIVECVRIRALIADHAEEFITRVYTPREVRACQGRRKSTELFSACWSAKEAVMKCLATSKAKRLSWLDIEIGEPAGGRPSVFLHNLAAERAAKRKISAILVTLAMCREYAASTAIAVR